MSGTLPNSNAVSFVPLLRLLQHASLWAISVPKICWMVFSLLLLLATALCFLALLSSSHRSKPGPCVLQLKALLCALMLLLDHLKLPDSFHTIVPIGSSSHDATAASSSPSPGQTASPMHPLDISFLLELPGDVVALGHDGGISHVKSAVSTLEPVWHAVPNTGEGDCFWLSLQDIVGPPGAARCKVAGWLQDHPNHPAHHEAALVAEAGLTTEWHVNATVQAYCASFPQGCFVFHQPSQCCVLSSRLSSSCLVSFCRPSSGILPMLALYWVSWQYWPFWKAWENNILTISRRGGVGKQSCCYCQHYVMLAFMLWWNARRWKSASCNLWCANSSWSATVGCVLGSRAAPRRFARCFGLCFWSMCSSLGWGGAGFVPAVFVILFSYRRGIELSASFACTYLWARWWIRLSGTRAPACNHSGHTIRWSRYVCSFPLT